MVTTTTKVSVRTVLRVERTLKMAKPVLSNSKVKIVATLLPQREPKILLRWAHTVIRNSKKSSQLLYFEIQLDKKSYQISKVFEILFTKVRFS